ncbi:MAG: DUF4911 domain-containing protein [Nitrospinae bacterium]|nr:DUF4911 domain-containing protein [Nitrospinota bacterium]
MKENLTENRSGIIDYSDVYRIIIKVRREDIVYLNGIFESYDNLAIIRTIDRWESLVEILASPYFVSDVKKILEELKKEIQLEIIEEPG